MSDTKPAPPEWVSDLKQAACYLADAQVKLMKIGEQWTMLHHLRIELAQEMERLKLVLEARHE